MSKSPVAVAAVLGALSVAGAVTVIAAAVMGVGGVMVSQYKRGLDKPASHTHGAVSDVPKAKFAPSSHVERVVASVDVMSAPWIVSAPVLAVGIVEPRTVIILNARLLTSRVLLVEFAPVTRPNAVPDVPFLVIEGFNAMLSSTTPPASLLPTIPPPAVGLLIAPIA